MSSITLSKPGKALITIGGDNAKDVVQTLSSGTTKINVNTQHNPTQEATHISGTTQVQINIKNPSAPIDAQTAAYNALIQNNTPGSEEIFNSGEWIYWSQSLLDLLDQGSNPELRLDVQVPVSTTPQTIGIGIQIPACITNIFPDGSYTINTSNGPVSILAGDAGQNQYQASITTIPLTNLVM